MVILIWGVLLAAYHGIFGAFFLTPSGALGSDFGLALASLVDGYIWFSKNGLLDVPWFTPSFCGGQPLFADPQSGYYSVLQWLTFVTDPLTASYLTLLFFASVGYFGIYWLARRQFGLPVPWGLLAAALYFFNGFLAHRTIEGHLGFYAIMLAPWLAVAMLTPTATVIGRLGFAVLSGCIVAYWLQAGLTTLILPASLSVALLLLVYRLYRPWPKGLWVRLLGAVGICGVLSASKLVASLSFYSHFERTQYLLPGFDNPVALVVANLVALFGPSGLAALVGSKWLVNQQWLLFEHEWAYGFTVVPILAITRARRLAQRAAGAGANPNPQVLQAGGSGYGLRIVVWLGIVLVSVIPIALQFYTPQLNALYKAMPVVGATVAPMRWLIIYLPVLPVVTALLARRALGGRQQGAARLVAGLIVVLIGLTLAEFWQYFPGQSYSPDTVLGGYRRLAGGEVHEHRVRSIGGITDPVTGSFVLDERRNDLVVDGVSAMRCYNPSFGYQLEKLPDGGIVAGEVLKECDGFLNIRNPACFVFPKENHCAPGDRFRVDQRNAAEAFVSYRPFEFERSWLQTMADWVTMTGLVVVAVFLFLIWPASLLRHRG